MDIPNNVFIAAYFSLDIDRSNVPIVDSVLLEDSSPVSVRYFPIHSPSGLYNSNMEDDLDAIPIEEVVKINKMTSDIADKLFSTHFGVSCVTATRKDAKNCVVVYVNHLNVLQLFDDPIPSHFEGYEVIFLEGIFNKSTSSYRKIRPICCGLKLECKHNDDDVQCSTLTCFAKDVEDNTYVITTGHTFTDEKGDISPTGWRIYQSNHLNEDELIGTEIINLSSSCVDAAAVYLNDEIQINNITFCWNSPFEDDEWNRLNSDDKTKNKTTKLPKLTAAHTNQNNINKDVYKIGLKTGLTHGKVHRYACHVSSWEYNGNPYMYDFDMKHKNCHAVLKTQMKVKIYSDKGDSGALVWQVKNNGEASACGMLIGDIGKMDAIVTPIESLMEQVKKYNLTLLIGQNDEDDSD